jgi:antitoxin ParD1/3/4
MPAAEKISITLTLETNRITKQRVEAGDFATANKLMREAVRVWQRREDEYRERIAAIKKRIRRSFDEARAELKRYRKARAKAGQ